MKAKEYAKRFIDSNRSDECLRHIANDFFMEIEQMVKARHVQVDSAMIAIFRELDQKYQTFCPLI